MPGSTKILLVRHGQDTDNAAGILNGHRDTDLTPLGREQAAAVAEKLADEGVKVVLSSPLQRTRQTAQIIADRIGRSQVVAEPLLIERDFGEMTGKPVADVAKLAAKTLVTDRVTYFLEAPGAEDFPTLYRRAQAVLEKIRSAYPGRTVLAVTHGDIGKMVRAAYNGWTWEQGLKTPYFANSQVLKLTDGGEEVE